MPACGAFPGGKIEAGETIENAALRELHEETGLRASVLRVFGAVDAFDRDDSGHLRQHFVLVTVMCEWMSGDPAAGDGATELRWFTMDDLESSDIALSLDVAQVARRGAFLAGLCEERLVGPERYSNRPPQ